MQHELRLWNKDRPEVLEVVRSLRSAAASVGDGAPLLIGESYIPVERMARYLGSRPGDAFDLVFDFDFLFAGWDAPRLRASIESAEALLPDHGWPCRALSSHDVSRQATRFGVDAARAAAVLLLATRGTPVVYMGEEIGMADVAPPALPDLDRSGRDASRSPMQWEDRPGGGFTTGTPWLPLGDVAACNVASQRGDSASILSLYRSMIGLRHDNDAIGLGGQRSIDLPADVPVVAYVRTGRCDVVVAVNAGSVAVEVDLLAASRGRLPDAGRLLLGTLGDRQPGGSVQLEGVGLAANEAVVVDLG
jgi:alpha-glucosidase